MKFLTLIEGSLFLLLAILHFYWAFGGKWGFLEGLPTTKTGQFVLNPKATDSLMVGVVLLAFSAYFLNAVLYLFELPSWLQQYSGWAIALIFLIRAIGDFKYVGFFKKIRQTGFAKRDSRYFSPLCLILSGIAFFYSLQQ